MLKSRKIIESVLVLAGLGLIFAGNANAADLRFSNVNNNQIFRVAAGDNVKNLYTAGGQVIVDANSSKDAVIAGGTVTVNGNTADDLIVAGGNIYLKGNVGGSTRVAGGTINVDGKITGDLVILGGTVYVSSNAAIGGDVVVAGGSLVIDAPVAGSIQFAGGSLEINNTVGGDINAKLSRGLILDANANIKGTLNYQSPLEYQRDANAKTSGQVNFTQRNLNRTAAFAALLTIAFFIRLVAVLITSLLLFYFFRKPFTSAVENTRNGGFWKNIGIGFLVLVVTPIVGILLLATIIGYYLAIITFLAYILTLIISGIIGSVALGSWMLWRVNGREFRVDYRAILVGLIVVAILRVIPLVGWLVMLLVLLTGLGAVSRQFWQSRK